jgi:hypothetical protein
MGKGSCDIRVRRRSRCSRWGRDAGYVLCDLDPASVSSLIEAAEELRLTDRVEVVAEDGPSVVWK